MKKILYLSLSLSIILILSIVLYLNFSKIENQIEQAFIHQMDNISHQNKVKIQWSSLSVLKMKLTIQAKGFQIHHPKRSLLTFPYISFQINIIQSLIKKKLIFNVQIKDWVNNIHIPRSQITSESLPEFIPLNLPLYKVAIANSDVNIKTTSHMIQLKNIKLIFKNRKNFLFTQVDSQVFIDNLLFQVNGQLDLSSEKINIHYFKMTELSKKKPSSLFALGHVQPSLLNVQSFYLDLKANLSSTVLNQWIQIFNPTQLSKVSGSFKIQSQISYSKKDGFKGPFQIEAENFQWKHISISKIMTKGQWNQHDIQLNMAHLEKSDEWTALLENTQLKWNKQFPFSSDIHLYIKNFQSIEKILKIDTGLRFNSPLVSNCTGQIIPVEFQCQIEGPLNNVDIAITKDPFIASIPQVQFSGHLDGKKKTLKGHLNSGSTTHVQFQTSFFPHFKTTFNGVIDFSDITHIYGFDVQGKTNVSKGTMELLSNKKFSLKTSLNAREFILDGWKMGHLNTHLSITNDDLVFNRINGSFNKSKYRGRIKILFKKPRIQMTSQFQPLLLEDLSQSVNFPYPISGQGSAQFSMNSPLDWKKIQYNLQSEFKEVYLSNEFFTNTIVNITSTQGLSTLKQALAQKIQGQVEATGTFRLFDKVNIAVKGNSLILEKLDFLNNFLNPHLAGIIDFQLNLKGAMKSPQYTFQANSKNLLYYSSPLGASSLKLTFFENNLTGKAQFFNKKIQIRKLRWNKKNNRLSLNLQTHQANILPLIPIDFSSDFSSQVTGDSTIHLPLNTNYSLTGYLALKNLLLIKGTHQLKLQPSINIQFNDGAFTFEKPLLKFQSNNKDLLIKKISSSKSLLSGPIRLEFLTPFFPLVEQAQGVLDMHFSVQNTLNQFAPNGSLQIKNGVLQLKAFLNAFQSVHLHSTLTPKELTIKKMTAQTQNGNLTGTGVIDYSTPGLLPINIDTEFDRLVLTLSESTQIQGSGSMNFSGDKRPYTMAGLFFLENGYSKGSLTSDADIIAQSIETTPWLNLKLSVHLKNPFLIQNELIDASVKGSLYFVGSYNQPLVSGTLDLIPDGIFRLRDYDFRISSGQFQYERNDLFNPLVNIEGQTNFQETRFADEREISNNYEITAQVQGPVRALNLKLSSQPSLSENSILSMMTLGAPSVGFPGGGTFSNVAQYSYSQIASALFEDTMGKRLESLLGVRLSIIPYVNQAKTSNRVRALKKWSDNLKTSATTTINEIDRSLQIEYNLSPNLSLLGTWRENRDVTVQEEYNLEIEYKIDF